MFSCIFCCCNPQGDFSIWFVQPLCAEIRNGSCMVWCLKINPCSEVSVSHISVKFDVWRFVQPVWTYTCRMTSHSLRGWLGWDTGSIWQTEMQIINYSYSLPPSSASSVEFLNIWQRQQNPPQSSFSPLSMKTDKKKAALLWSVFPSILLRPHLLSGGSSRYSIRAALAHNRSSTLGDPCTHQTLLSRRGMLLVGDFNILQPCVPSNLVVRR